MLLSNMERLIKLPVQLQNHGGETELKSVRVHFAPGKIAITLELLGQFLRFLDQNDRHSLGVLLIF